MREIQVQKLTKDNFGKYGEFLDLLDESELKKKSIFAGIMDRDFRTESIEAFYVPKGTFVKLNPLIVHGTQYPVDKEDVHIVCILPGRTFKNDMLSRRLETGEQIRITRGV